MSSVDMFMKLTGTSAEEAAFFLESAGGDFQLAVENYTGSLQPSSRGGSGDSGNTTRKPSSIRSSANRVSSLADFRREDANDDKQQRYYSGGSETSGQQLLGGNPKQRNEDMASKIIQKAKEALARGEVPVPPVEESKFSGHGQRLGSQRSDPRDTPLSQPRAPKKIKITFYEDGFTFDDGELRSFDVPENARILETINRGFVPQELGGDADMVDVELEDRKHEKYTPPKFQAFKSEGRSLGGSSSTVTGSSSPVTKPLTNYQCDESQPFTTLQLRLPSGAVRQKFNLSDTIQTVKDFIAGRESQLQNVPFSLVLAIPPRTELTNTQQTLQDAGLKNSALMIKK